MEAHSLDPHNCILINVIVLPMLFSNINGWLLVTICLDSGRGCRAETVPCVAGGGGSALPTLGLGQEVASSVVCSTSPRGAL